MNGENHKMGVSLWVSIVWAPVIISGLIKKTFSYVRSPFTDAANNELTLGYTFCGGWCGNHRCRCEKKSHHGNCMYCCQRRGNHRAFFFAGQSTSIYSAIYRQDDRHRQCDGVQCPGSSWSYAESSWFAYFTQCYFCGTSCAIRLAICYRIIQSQWYSNSRDTSAMFL